MEQQRERSSELALLQKCVQAIKKRGVWQGIVLTRGETRFIVKVQFPHGSLTRARSPMGNFGEDLRKERLARGFALEDISAVTKISQRHLIALEQERFRLLPGGILSKGIVRGYASAIGLDAQEWTERFLQAYNTGGQTADDDSGWTTFASNVGKARILHREAVEIRMRWIGAGLLLLAVAAAAFITVRYYGVREGWWRSLLPIHGVSTAFRGAWTSTRGLVEHFVSRI
jgi:transcriptional regulator with XRE-family HTH domain